MAEKKHVRGCECDACEARRKAMAEEHQRRRERAAEALFDL